MHSRSVALDFRKQDSNTAIQESAFSFVSPLAEGQKTNGEVKENERSRCK